MCDWLRGDRESLPSFNVIMGKGGKDRLCACGAETVAAIKRYLGAREGYDSLDPLLASGGGVRLTGRAAAMILHRLSERAGLPPDRYIHPHSLRHFCATAWIRAKIDLERLRLQLGHTSLETTQKYLSLCPDDIQRAHAQASPLARLGIRVKK